MASSKSAKAQQKMPKYANNREFAEKHLKLVEMERQAEIDEQKELVANIPSTKKLIVINVRKLFTLRIK